MECLDNSAMSLPNELWIEIFRKLDNRTLLNLALVSQHWHELIFTHLIRRFQLNLDPGKLKFPIIASSMIPGRNYKHLRLKLSEIEGAPMKIFQQLVPNLESLTLNLKSLELSVLIQMLGLCPRIKELHLYGFQFKHDYDIEEFIYSSLKIRPAIGSLELEYKKLGVFEREFQPCILNGSESEMLTASKFVPAIASLGLNVNNLDIVERIFQGCISNVTKLDMVVHQPGVSLLERMAPQLKILKLEVYEGAIEYVLNLRFPALDTLALKLHASSYKDSVFCDFLLGSQSLKTAFLVLRKCEFKDVFPAITKSLPLVEKLQIVSDTVTSLEGLERMTNLKKLSIRKSSILANYYNQTAIQPMVQSFECHDIHIKDQLRNVLRRFPNLRYLSLSMRDFYDVMTRFGDAVPLLKEFTISVYRFLIEIIGLMEELTSLEKIVINAAVFAKSNFYHLRRVIILPSLRSLEVNTKWALPEDLTRKVAAVNRSCALILNGDIVAPDGVVRRSAVKRVKPSV